jgi:hypothetical protein
MTVPPPSKFPPFPEIASAISFASSLGFSDFTISADCADKGSSEVSNDRTKGVDFAMHHCPQVS